MAEPIAAPDPRLATDEFVLRPFTMDDIGAVIAGGHDPDVAAHTLMPAQPSEDVARDWLRRAIAGWQLGLARFAIAPIDDPGRCVGQIGIRRVVYPEGNAEAFYWLLPEARGLGWASRSLRLLSAWAFGSLGVERIALLIDLDNDASMAVAERAGFTREGIHRGYLEVPHRGRVDLWSWSRLRTDPEP